MRKLIFVPNAKTCSVQRAGNLISKFFLLSEYCKKKHPGTNQGVSGFIIKFFILLAFL
jgi:hypothetical protein